MNQNVKFTNTQLSNMTFLKSKFSNVIFNQRKIIIAIFFGHVDHLKHWGNPLKSTFYSVIMIPCKFLNSKKIHQINYKLHTILDVFIISSRKEIY